MPIELVWSNQARTDLLDIYVLIGVERPAVAERYLDRIESKVRTAEIAAADGRAAVHIRPSMRMLVENPYLLLYRTVLTPMKAPSAQLRSSASSTAVGTCMACFE